MKWQLKQEVVSCSTRLRLKVSFSDPLLFKMPSACGYRKWEKICPKFVNISPTSTKRTTVTIDIASSDYAMPSPMDTAKLICT